MLLVWSFAAGLLHVAWYSSLPNPLYLALGILLGFIPLDRFAVVPRLAAAFCAGALLSTLRLENLIEQQLPEILDRQTFSGRFEIVSLVDKGDKSVSFRARLHRVLCAENLPCHLLRNRTVRLSWFFPTHEVSPGDVWTGEFKLKRPRGMVNPGGFDYQAWVLSEGLVATGYITGEIRRVSHKTNWAAVRGQIRQELLKVGGHTEFMRFWLALTLADRAAITPEDWQVLQRTGTVHLIAISGLHIGLVALLLHWLGSFCARVWASVGNVRGDSVKLLLWLPAVLSCSGAAFYAALAGFSIPTTRALVTCLVLQCMRLIGWRLPASTTLAIVVAAVALTDPLAAMAPGFWLSFMAVLCLVYLAVQLNRSTGRLAKAALYVRLQLALSVALVPPLIALGQMASLTAPLANLVAVPLISLVVVPGLFLAMSLVPFSPGLAVTVLNSVDWVFAWLWCWLDYLSRASWSAWWPTHAFSGVDVLAAVVAVALVLAPAGLRTRGLGVLILVSALLLPRVQPFDVRLTVLDVGQGLSVIVQSQNDALVYDTGPRYSESFDAGNRIVLPYLRREGVRSADLIISHDDLDHSGGAPGVAAELALRRNLSGEPLESLVTEPCEHGQAWFVGRVEVTVLWPERAGGYSGNAASCTLLLRFDGGQNKQVHILLPGDIDHKVENRIVSHIPHNLDVLVASHHGSSTSSSYGFVRHTAPDYVIYSAGYKNAYHHPSAKVTRRFRREGSVELNTADAGAILMTWSGDQVAVSKTREDRQKPWFW